MNNGNAKLIWGFIAGAVAGAAAVYLSDKERREKLVEDIVDAADVVKDNAKDAYYAALIKGRRAKRDLSRYMADVRDEAEEAYGELIDKARRISKGAARNAEESLSQLED